MAEEPGGVPGMEAGRDQRTEYRAAVSVDRTAVLTVPSRGFGLLLPTLRIHVGTQHTPRPFDSEEVPGRRQAGTHSQAEGARATGQMVTLPGNSQPT